MIAYLKILMKILLKIKILIKYQYYYKIFFNQLMGNIKIKKINKYIYF